MLKRHKWIFAGCFYTFFVNGMLALMMGAVMPMILTEYQLGYDKGGLFLSFHSIGNLMASFLAGVVPFYLGKKNSIVALSSMTAIGFTGIMITKSPLLLMMMFFMTGIGRGSVSNINNSIVNDVSDGKTGALNVLHIFFAVGAFMAPFIASWCIQSGLGWKYAIGAVAVLGAMAVIVYSMMKIDNTKGLKKGKTGEVKNSFNFLKNIDFYIASGILFFYLGVETSLNGWIVTYLKDTGMMSTSLAQVVLSILWIVIIFGRMFCAYISKYIDKRSILLISSTGAMLSFLLFMISSGIVSVIFSMIGLGFCLAGIYPTTISNVGGVIKGSGIAMGTLLAIAGLGAILMPYIIGAIAQKSGIAGGMAATTVCAILMFMFALINRLKNQKLGSCEEKAA